ncbi:MAG: SdpA family antimicrobial peptide system protein [Chitinophagaceae bacterium]
MNIRNKKVICLFITFLVALLSFVSLVALTPENALTPNFETKRFLSSILPEGWSFFTRSPREEEADLYKIINDSLIEIINTNSEPLNFFGLSRQSRRIGMEVSMIANQIPDTVWKETTFVSCKLSTLNVFLIKNKKNLYLLKSGTYLVSIHTLIPWAYAKFPTHYTTKYKLAKVRI